LIGRDGVSLAEHWQNGMRSLHGIMTSRFPNLFLIGGIEQAATSINNPHVTSSHATHVATLIARFLKDSVAVAEVTPEAEQRWADELARVHVDRSGYDAECTPSYYNNEGNRNDPRPTAIGGQYGPGPIGYIAVIQDWIINDIDRDIRMTTE
jgi:hypothetical protein